MLMEVTKFRDILLHFRARHKLTQKQTAEILGVHVNVVQRYESDKARPRPVNRLTYEEILRAYDESMKK